MYVVTKQLDDFCYGHRLGKGYSKKCINYHGHNGQVQVTLGANGLDKYDMVIDFGEIKKLFNTWVQDNWDHATMVSKSDKALLEFLEKEENKHFVIPENQNSTAEFMSRFLFEKFEELLEEEKYLRKRNQSLEKHSYSNAKGDEVQMVDINEPLFNGVQLLEVKVWETKDSFATWRREQLSRSKLYA